MKKILGLLLVVFWALSSPMVVLAADAQEIRAEENPALQRGIELYKQGRLERALREFQKITSREPLSPSSFRAHYLMARIFYEKKDPQKALSQLANIPDLKKTPPVWLLQGAALIASGLTEQGLDMLKGVEEQSLSQGDRSLYLQALAEGNIRQGKILPGLYLLQAALLLSQEGNFHLLDLARDALATQAGSATLDEARFMFQGMIMGDLVSLEKARRLRVAGHSNEAISHIRDVLRSSSHPLTHRKAEEAYLEITGEAWMQRSIGVILPLSGRYASFGRLVKRGMEMALQADQENGKGAVKLIFKDSGADADKASLAVRDLARDGQVVGIVGPIFGSAALNAARQAQQERIPILTLSPRQGLPQVGDYVFRSSLTSSAQVDAILQHAIVDQGLGTFAVLYPDNKMGRDFVASFLGQVGFMGGEVVASQSYSEKATDFRVPIKLLLGLDPNAPEPEEEPKEDLAEESAEGLAETDEEGPQLPFEALFIPDYADRVGLLIPQLAYYGVENVQLLGISGWNDPELVKIAGKYVDGAVFPDGFFVYSPYLFVKDFVDRFQELYKQEPSILDAQGFDAANIVLKLFENPQVRTRDDFRDALGRLQNYPGVTGATTFDAFGEAQKVLYLLQVRNGTIEQIN
ncbi:MAG: penicillin-binding protein activator [Deltaproteobacteria bacterium]|nr:penicillin-binding protein activator [Deltaproteobacteria bacterium]